MSAEFPETGAHATNSFDSMQPVTAQDKVSISGLPTVPLKDEAERKDPLTPDIQLTPRQQRVLHYLARRRRRKVAVTQRTRPDDIVDSSSDMRTTAITPAPEANGGMVEAIPAEQGAIPNSNDSVTTITPTPPNVPNVPNVPRHLPKVRANPSDVPARRSPVMGAGIGIRTSTGTTIIAQRVSHNGFRKRTSQQIWRRKKVLRHLSRKFIHRTHREEQRQQKRLWLTIACSLLSLLVVFLSVATAGYIVANRFITTTQTKYEQQVLTLADLLPLDNLKMYDSKGVMIGQMTDQGLHTTVPLSQVSLQLQDATIATEDHNFWTNPGVDIPGILRAALADLRSGRVVEGGSTITQQLIKNLIVGNETTIVRKLEEIVLTPQLNSHYTKAQILGMYLNSIYYGNQAYGIDAAATVYFGLEDTPGRRASAQLDLAQSALLAGIPSNPAAYNPFIHPQTTFNRFETVLNLMVDQRYITRVQALDAIHEAQSPNFFKSASSLVNRAPHFFNFVLSELQSIFHLQDSSQLSRSGMIVNTTLDINLQDKIQKIAQQHIAELRAAHHVTNAAEVLIDFHTGAVISLLGSINYNDASIDGQFDVATQGYRQPGSSFKPYVYVTAFAQGASPAQAIDDAPTTIDLPGGDPPTFSPTNYDLSYHGHMTLRCALQNSLNVPAVKVLQHAGISAAMQTAAKMGISSYQGTPGYSLVLGGLGVRLIDHTSAMGTFANGGVHVPYYTINSVVAGNSGAVLYQHQRNPGTRAISPQLAYMMTSVLSDNASRIPEFYDCNVLQLYANSQQQCYEGKRGVVRPAAAKTGTTNDFRDNWTVGYTTDFVMGVWAGNDDNTPMVNVTGVQGAAPIWHDSMLLAEQGHPIRNFAYPGGLQKATVTYPDGVTTTDWFLPGTVPSFTTQPTPASTGESTPSATPTTRACPGRLLKRLDAVGRSLWQFQRYRSIF
ncbi:MAG TPA: transglycosylase domain-containing protein [Ktedonobacteraceae bacterium]|nr:transglycosylase domain-containing protein [Ktedonobacteraceae bacterium]